MCSRVRPVRLRLVRSMTARRPNLMYWAGSAPWYTRIKKSARPVNGRSTASKTHLSQIHKDPPFTDEVRSSLGQPGLIIGQDKKVQRPGSHIGSPDQVIPSEAGGSELGMEKAEGDQEIAPEGEAAPQGDGQGSPPGIVAMPKGADRRHPEETKDEPQAEGAYGKGAGKGRGQPDCSIKKGSGKGLPLDPAGNSG